MTMAGHEIRSGVAKNTPKNRLLWRELRCLHVGNGGVENTAEFPLTIFS
jgi:hypothetical protein